MDNKGAGDNRRRHCGLLVDRYCVCITTELQYTAHNNRSNGFPFLNEAERSVERSNPTGSEFNVALHGPFYDLELLWRAVPLSRLFFFVTFNFLTWKRRAGAFHTGSGFSERRIQHHGVRLINSQEHWQFACFHAANSSSFSKRPFIWMKPTPTKGNLKDLEIHPGTKKC